MIPIVDYHILCSRIYGLLISECKEVGSSFIIVIDYGLEECSSISWQGQVLFLSLLHPDWSSLSLISSAYWGFFCWW
jgi:hypothetical protein